MSADRIAPAHRLARIEQMIGEYRERKQRDALQKAMKLWRLAEAHQQLLALGARPERRH